MSRRRSGGRVRRCRQLWSSALAAGVLLALGACAPRVVEPPVTPPAPGAPALPRAEPEVRVGLLVDTASVEIAATGGFELVATSDNRVLARVPDGGRRTVTAGAAGMLQVTGAAAGAMAAVPGPLLVRPIGDGRLNVGGKPYRGSALVQTAGPGRVTAINLVSLEEYLLGVVPHEIGRVGEDLLEAAKAQAVAARTYAVAHRGRRSALGFDYYATVQDQVYGGSADEHGVTTRAVQETTGEILTHQGTPIEAYYHSTCAGQTAAIDEVWNERPRPYLVSVVDVDPRTGQAYDHFSSRFRWTQRWSADSLAQTFARTLADSLPRGAPPLTEVRDLRILERTPSDRVRRLRIDTDAGMVHVGGDRVRWIFLTPEGRILNSSKFELELVRDASGRVTEVTANGGGWGHGIGMCQVGAMGRARAGQSYRTILLTYYPGTELRKLY
ncbi:SpoIID/LytB domain-containing protein [soil metagenome]